jgi:cytochrome c
VIVFSKRLALSLPLALISAILPAQAQDIDKGKQAFAVCAACHAQDKNGVGPQLGGVIGRTAGTVEGFHYSRAMKHAGIVWDAKILDAYLEDPQKVVPGNVMPFAGISDPQQRADVIAYLGSLKSASN